jgi:hypothetical protein
MKTKKHMRTILSAIAVALGLAGAVQGASITQDLVVHLTFDNTFNDSSGNGNHASPVGDVPFEAGKVAGGAHIVNVKDGSINNYVTLGYPELLKFGSAAAGNAVDFSVGFWVKVIHQADDQAFVANKNWNSGSNPGWVINSQGDGMKWNLRDDGGSARRDSPHVAPQVVDGQWHHILVTLVRSGNATIYVDGATVNVSNMAPDSGKPVGSLDTDGLGLSVNIGQDGTGTYTDGGAAEIDMVIDDLGIWRRGLSAAEVSAVFNAGLAGKDLGNVPAVVDPYVSATTPAALATGVLGESQVSAVITDGLSAVAPGSIQLLVNDVAVTGLTTSKAGVETTVTSPTLLLPAGLNRAALIFANSQTPQTFFTNSWAFAVASYTTVPADFATPVGSANTPGFVYRAVQARSDSGLPNTLARTEDQLAGTLIDPATGAPYVDHAIPGPNADGSYDIDVVNFNINNADAGSIPGDGEFPGIPGDEFTVNNFAVEVLGYLHLKPGYHRFGVNSDDGFQVRIGKDARDRTSPILGEFNGGRGAGDTLFDFIIQTEGIYAIRLIYEQGAGDASAEFFSVNLHTGNRTLINDLSAADAVKAYRKRTGAANLPFVSSLIPSSQTDVAPDVVISANLKDADTQVVVGTVKLFLDAEQVAATVQKTGGDTKVTYDPPGLLESLSTHALTVVFSDNAVPANTKSNTFTFQVVSYVNKVLPDPIVLETFTGVAEGQLPAGWRVVNYTAPDAGGEDLSDPHSDNFLNWVVISRDRVVEIGGLGRWDADRRLQVAPGQVVNGKIVTNLIHGNFIYAESDVRSGSQVQYLFSPEFNLTGKTNLWVSFNSIYEQNQDSIGSVEYSIDGGQSWLPILYLVDQADLVLDPATGNVDGYATLAAPRADTAIYTDPDTGEDKGGYYGAFVGVESNRWSTLGPFLQGRINDNPVESKRVELFRLPNADNQAKVSFRFAQGGTASWYFGIDDFGLYSITAPQAPEITTQPASQLVSAGASVTFKVVATGTAPLQYQWRRNADNIPGATSDTLALDAVQEANAGTYTVVVKNAGGTATSLGAVLTVFSGPLTQALAAHLPFDNTYDDASGNGNNAAPVGTLSFDAGQIGGAVHIVTSRNGVTNNYVTLGYPAALKFGSEATGNAVDFSVSFWTKVFHQTDDQPFISNKNWDSGSNRGWVINSQGDGMKWNYRDSVSTRRDSPHVAPAVVNGAWHHIVVTFERKNVGSIYVDGGLVNTANLAPASGAALGSADTDDLGLRVNLGQDGRGAYTDGGAAEIDMLMDDVAIWRRLLTPQEVATIYQKGQAGQSFAVSAQLRITGVSAAAGNLTISWSGGNGPFQLQTKASLSDASWQNVGSPVTGHSASAPLTGAMGFFRVVGQ